MLGVWESFVPKENFSDTTNFVTILLASFSCTSVYFSESDYATDNDIKSVSRKRLC